MLTTPPPLFGVVASRRGRAVRYDGARVLGGAFAARHGEKKVGFGSTRARQVAFRSRDHVLGSSWLDQPCSTVLAERGGVVIGARVAYSTFKFCRRSSEYSYVRRRANSKRLSKRVSGSPAAFLFFLAFVMRFIN